MTMETGIETLDTGITYGDYDAMKALAPGMYFALLGGCEIPTGQPHTCGPVFGPLTGCHTVHASEVILLADGEEFTIEIDKGLFHYKGLYYSDCTVFVYPFKYS